MNCLIKHWTVSVPVKTAEQIEAEKSLFCIPIFKTNRFIAVKSIPFNRWFLFCSAFLTQFCCGSLYSWSVYNVPIDTYVYGDSGKGNAVYTFYMAAGALGVTAAILGPWLERNGPRLGLFLGSTMFLTGNIITAISLSQRSIVGVYIGYGLFCGFGLGINYISPVSALQKWFPDLRGTAAGFAVGGFGAGSAVWGKVYLPVMDLYGLPGAFVFLGILMSSIMYICALVMRTPPPDFSVKGLNMHGEEISSKDCEADPVTPKVQCNDERTSILSEAEYAILGTEKHSEIQREKDIVYQSKIKQLKLLDCLFSFDFLCIYLTLFSNILFGLVVLSRLSSMVTEVFERSSTQAATAVAVNGVFNCAGRLISPMFSDFVIRVFNWEPASSRKFVFFVTLVSQSIIVGTLPEVMNSKSYGIFLAEIWILTFLYGGGFGTIPCFLTDMFGAYNIGAMHGFVLTAWSIAGVGGGLGFTSKFNSLVHSGTDPVDAYIYNFKWIFGIILFGFIPLTLIRTNHEDRFADGYKYSLFGKTLVHFRRRD